jgi:hypothetical protein
LENSVCGSAMVCVFVLCVSQSMVVEIGQCCRPYSMFLYDNQW